MERTTALNSDKKHVWHPFTQMLTSPEPLHIVRAKNATLYDSDGREYIDANSSWWVNVHGHGNEHIGTALAEQFSQLDHVIFAGATHPQAIRLAERICTILPENLTKVFFSDDGSTAVEVALKMAFQYWTNKKEPRRRVLAIDGAYHGDTFGAMSVGQRGVFNQPFEHLFFDVDFLHFPNGDNHANILKDADKLLSTGEVACLIVEPLVQGSAGMRIYEAEFLDELVVLAHKYGVLVIFDEVMTGWGRTGKLFALNHCWAKPDMVCLSKGLTGGVLPLGLTVASEEIYEAFLHPETNKALLHGHSFTGSAMACAAANASLDIFEEHQTWENIERIEQQHVTFRRELVKNKHVKNAHVCGTILRFEIETGEGNYYFSAIRDKAYNYFLNNGCLIRPLGNVIYINPPYCITVEELNTVYEAISDFLRGLE